MSGDKIFVVGIRFLFGFIFIWAFADKLFGLNFATTPENSWLQGGSPTAGFLKNGTAGPLAGFYQSIAGTAAVDWLFMGGLVLVSLGLLTGILLKPAALGGALMMLLIYSAVWPPKQNPIVDEHIIYAAILLWLALRRQTDAKNNSIPFLRKNE